MLFPSQSDRDRVAALSRELGEQKVDAVTAAQRLLEVEPLLAAPYAILGAQAAASGDRTEAERLLWKAVELRPFGPATYIPLWNFYRADPATGGFAVRIWNLVLWHTAVADEVLPQMAEVLETAIQDAPLDFKDPDAYFDLAEAHEKTLRDGDSPAPLLDRLQPYRLLKDLARGAWEDLSEEVLDRIRSAPGPSLPVWRSVVRQWARDPDHTDREVLLFVVALLGEFSGPEVLEDLWELSTLVDEGVFLHAHWALCRLAERCPEEFILGVRRLIAGAPLARLCGMAEHLGVMRDTGHTAPVILALTQDFPRIAREEDAPYLLIAAAGALSKTGHPDRAAELVARYERLLTEDARRWIRDTLDAPGGFVPRLVKEELPELSLEDVLLSRVLFDDEDEDYDEGDDEWDEDDEDFQEPVRARPKPGRNDPCWCGSGKKYKKCHLEADEEAGRLPEEEPPPSDPVRAEAMGALLSTADRVFKRRDLRAAATQYFGEDANQHAELQKGSEGFLLWYLFDFRRETSGRTAVEEHLRNEATRLSPAAREMMEAWRDSRYGLFEVQDSPPDKDIELKDLCAGGSVFVAAGEASLELDAGDCILARLESPGGRVAFSAGPEPVPRQDVPALVDFIQTESQAAARTPAAFMRANIHRLHRMRENL